MNRAKLNELKAKIAEKKSAVSQEIERLNTLLSEKLFENLFDFEAERKEAVLIKNVMFESFVEIQREMTELKA